MIGQGCSLSFCCWLRLCHNDIKRTRQTENPNDSLSQDRVNAQGQRSVLGLRSESQVLSGFGLMVGVRGTRVLNIRNVLKSKRNTVGWLERICGR